MTSNDKDRPFISHCITGSSNSLPQDHFKKKCVQDLTCPLSRNWEHPQRFCLRWKDIYTSNTAFPERYLGRRSLQPAATQLHTGSTKIAGAVRRETWPGDARGLIQQNNRVFFFAFVTVMRDKTKPPNLPVNEVQSPPLPLISGDVPCDTSLTLVLGCSFTPLLTETDKGT